MVAGDTGTTVRSTRSTRARRRPMRGLAHDLVVKEEKAAGERRVSDAAEQVQKARERDRHLRELYATFVDLTQSADAQARGYELEDLLKELFALHEIRYRKSLIFTRFNSQRHL